MGSKLFPWWRCALLNIWLCICFRFQVIFVLICAVVLTLGYHCVCKLRSLLCLSNDDDYEFEGGMRTRVRHEVKPCFFFPWYQLLTSCALTERTFREAYEARQILRCVLEQGTIPHNYAYSIPTIDSRRSLPWRLAFLHQASSILLRHRTFLLGYYMRFSWPAGEHFGRSISLRRCLACIPCHLDENYADLYLVLWPFFFFKFRV
jgi:hypothetical protein